MPDHKPSLVYILLLNFRGTDDTFACLDSLKQLNYPNYRVIVVDNHSPDHSIKRLQTRLNEHPGEFHLIRSDNNLGYSGGNNLGIRYALEQHKADSHAYLWLLNNDTTVEPETLTTLVQETQKTGGLAGSLLLHPDGSYQQVGTQLNWWTGSSKGYAENTIFDGMAVETLTGASMLIPFNVLHAAGLLDESFFLYFEDGEYSLRCAQKGFSLTISLGSRVYHKEGATTGRRSLATQYYFHRNRLRLLWKFANPAQKITIGSYAAFRMLRAVVKSLLSSNPERTLSAKIQWLALRDFIKGISGPCPHDLSKLR